MIYHSLQYYVDKLKKGEHFSLARYGDGELYCMWGKQGQNSNGCRYSPELRAALLDSLKHKTDSNFYYGLQRVLPKDELRAKKEYPDVTWHDSEFLSEAVAQGKLYPFIEQLRKMDVMVVGNKSIWQATSDILNWEVFCEVPSSNAYDKKDLTKNIRDFLQRSKDIVILFSCGMAANAFISELHGQIDGWLIDVGHIWDPFTGNMSRCDLKGKTMEDINKNLCAE